jgi:UDP-N-acetylmuramate--alanine ligase
LNALSAIAVMNTRKIDLKKINEISSGIKTAKRRFQIEMYEGYTWINDYAHHPTEITATIEAARQRFPNKKIIAIFQPHTYTRVETFKDEFQDSLKKADKVYGFDIFGSAREKKGEVEIENLLDGIPNSEKITLENIEKLKKHKNEILLFMSAGDVEKYINEFKKIIMEESN